MNPSAPRRSSDRAFTLIELMAVVAIVGVLATIALVSYRRYILSAKTAEAVNMVGSIRAAEESYRAETLVYLDVSATMSTYYPNPTPNSRKMGWGANDATLDAPWQRLGVRADSGVYYGYAVKAGPAGAMTSGAVTSVGLISPPTWPAATEPWYVILAKGDLDDSSAVNSYVLSSSLSGEIYVENEGQ